MPRTTVASIVLHSPATLQELWSHFNSQPNYNSCPLSSTSISSQISWSHKNLEERKRSQVDNTVLSELQQLTHTQEQSVKLSRFLARKLSSTFNSQDGFTIKWEETERSQRDVLEDIRPFKRQAKRVNSFRVLPLRRKATGTNNGGFVFDYFVEWLSANAIFTSNIGTVPYVSELYVGDVERAQEMQHGLSMLRKLFGTDLTLETSQMEAVLIEQQNIGTDCRFVCSSETGGTLTKKILMGKYWDAGCTSKVANNLLELAISGFEKSLGAAQNINKSESRSNNLNTSCKMRLQSSTITIAIDACISDAIAQMLSQESGSSNYQENALAILCVGVAMLLAFMQINFTGPNLKKSWSGDDSVSSSLGVFVSTVSCKGASSGATSPCSKSQSSSSFASSSTTSVWSDYLAVDGEAIYTQAKRPELLCIASAIFRSLVLLSAKEKSSGRVAPILWSHDWWLIRCCVIWQQLIKDSHSQTLWDYETECFERLQSKGVVWQSNNDASIYRSNKWWTKLGMPDTLNISRASLCALAWQERTVALSQIQNFKGANECLQRTSTVLGIEIVVTGAQGRGTRFQTFDTPQLIAIVKATNQPNTDKADNNADLAPRQSSTHRNVKSSLKEQPSQLQHVSQFLHGRRPRDQREAAGVRTVTIKSVDPYSHLMDQPILCEQRAAQLVNQTVPAITQAMMLSECQYIQDSAAIDATVQSQMKTFLSQAIRHPQVWAVQTLALFQKSLLEISVSRMPERALLQLQALVDQHTR